MAGPPEPAAGRHLQSGSGHLPRITFCSILNGSQRAPQALTGACGIALPGGRAFNSGGIK